MVCYNFSGFVLILGRKITKYVFIDNFALGIFDEAGNPVTKFNMLLKNNFLAHLDGAVHWTSDHYKGCGNGTGYAQSNPLWVDLHLGECWLRFFKENDNYILSPDGSVDSFTAYSSQIESASYGEDEFVFNITVTLEERPEFMAFRYTGTTIVMGAVTNDIPDIFVMEGHSEWPSYKGIRFSETLVNEWNLDSINPDEKIYWYSDRTGNFEEIGKFSKIVAHPVTATVSEGETIGS